jgi:bifunctional NMN adenylyltransferase/nudix hydrolase
MKVGEPHYDVGVIVGRFQLPELHEAHQNLIRHVCDNHEKVIVVLGLSPLVGTQVNPLDYEARKQMILDVFPEVTTLFVKDVNNDELWSKRLDERLNDLLTPSQTAVLYGGRDSFISHYTGRFPTRELHQDVWVSGTEIRKSIAKASTHGNAEFRRGAIWAAFNRFPTAFPTVDVAIFNENWTKLLLGRKPYEKEFRFIGGFADPESETYEQDARREVMEETGIEITDPKYIGSAKIDDWRYRGEIDKIKTLLFVAKYLHGTPRPDDDIAEVKWFSMSELVKHPELLVPNHRNLLSLVAKEAELARVVNNLETNKEVGNEDKSYPGNGFLQAEPLESVS